ncbi:MAG: hypothetical protein ACJA1A_002052 [Saprospiraceae bacterium]
MKFVLEDLINYENCLDENFSFELVDASTNITNGDGVSFSTSGTTPAGELSGSVPVTIELDKFEVGFLNKIAIKLNDNVIANIRTDVETYTFTVVTVFKSALAGELTGTATLTSQEAGIGWDACAGEVWTGPVIFDRQQLSPFEDGEYLVRTMNVGQEFFEDLSFGAFYPCYGTTSQGSLPLGDLRLIDIDNTLSFSGASQWGEVYSISNVSTDGATLTFNWVNDYGEGALIQLVRNDGEAWPDLK